MHRVVEGGTEGRRFRVGIVISRFNQEITRQLLTGALDVLREKGVQDGDIETVWVPGAFEIPLVAQRMARSGQFHGLLALGCVIRGETPHFEYISSAATDGVARVTLETGVPVGFGVLTTETVEQARDRSDPRKYNRGGQAALTVLEMMNLLKELKS
jgi:6,7-dimethyl-8-ribityllumazine synthase